MRRTPVGLGALVVVLVVVVVLLSARPEGRPPATPTGTTSGSAAPPTATAPPTDQPSPPSVPLGTPVDVAAPDGGVLTLTVDSLTVAASCPARGGATAEPELAHFVVAEVTALFAAGGSDEDAARVDAGSFVIRAPDGRTQQLVATASSFACFDAEQLLPPFVEDGQEVSGLVVLDSATAHGRVVHAADPRAAWEF
ncbi:hypothetical protein V5H98_13765 [Georgenia sp. M64]|uniref:hypothetical protein n=1 Tax=Georgenia sp. M64 TaxID=3120520 RepID=UPI0030E553C4